MKKAALFILLSIVLCFRAYASDPKAELAKAVREVNSELPEPEQGGKRMVSVKYENNNVIYHFICNDDVVGPDYISRIEQHKSAIKSGLIKNFSGDDYNVRVFAEGVRKAQSGIKYIYESKQTGQRSVITILPSEM